MYYKALRFTILVRNQSYYLLFAKSIPERVLNQLLYPIKMVFGNYPYFKNVAVDAYKRRVTFKKLWNYEVIEPRYHQSVLLELIY